MGSKGDMAGGELQTLMRLASVKIRNRHKNARTISGLSIFFFIFSGINAKVFLQNKYLKYCYSIFKSDLINFSE